MTVRELIDKLKMIDRDKLVLVAGFAANALEAECVLDNTMENTAIIYVENVESEQLEGTDYKKI